MEPTAEHTVTLKTAYRHYWITGTELDPAADLPESAATPQPGARAPLLSLSSTHPAVIVATGIQYGDIPTTIRTYPAQPSIDDKEQWEEIAEADLTAASSVIFGNLDQDNTAVPLTDEDVPERAWRVRVSVRGADDARTVAYAAEGHSLTERHLIELWPSNDEELQYLRRDPRPWRQSS
ncbi:MAG: hypothetical protein JO362_22560 [Streptomycetaceae bacterium]|nr:hypothetical protein [Streptomycetaceae bacterium]